MDTLEAWASVDPVGQLPSDLAHKPGAPGDRRPDTLTEELRGQERWPWPPGARPVTGNATGSTGGHTAGSSHHWAEVPLSLPQEVGGGEDRHPSSDGGETETQAGLLTEEPRLTSPRPPVCTPCSPSPSPKSRPSVTLTHSHGRGTPRDVHSLSLIPEPLKYPPTPRSAHQPPKATSEPRSRVPPQVQVGGCKLPQAPA